MTQATKKIQGKFYPLTPDYTQQLRKAKLTAAEWRLWSYLISLDPWGDKYQDLPDTLAILSECDIKKSTFYKAIAKFQDLGLFDFQDRGFKFRNRVGIDKIRHLESEKTTSKISQNQPKSSFFENSETIPKIRKRFRKFGNDSENSENQPPNRAPQADPDSPQTLQTLQTPQTRGGEKILEIRSKNRPTKNN